MSKTSKFLKFQSVRPPTPPLENDNDFDIDACETGLELLDSKHLAYNTPDDSPNSTTDFMGKSPESRSAKRVDFVLIPNQIGGSARKGSRVDELKPRRSILKQSSLNFSSDSPSSDIIISVEETNVPAMLDHMIKGLASQDISSRYDAYMSINGCLKTYKDMPAKQSLAARMPTLDGYIRRDLAADTGDGVRVSQMVTEALKFVTSLCWIPETKSVMTAGFQVFLLNHSITMLGKEDTPKSLANLYLYLLSVQTFPTRVMNQEKVTRILVALKGIAERIQGRQAAAHRLAIYKRLLGQAKPIMALKASEWMEDLFNNLVSKTKEIRDRAIAVGFLAGQCYGSDIDISVADAVRKLMNSKKSAEAEKRYIDDVVSRLQGWLNCKQDTADIPSIWSIVILLLRTKPNYPERWEHFPQWLKLIQGCLNINDSKTRSEANLAWIRLIYTISPQQSTSQSISSLLFRPLMKQLVRQERERDSTGQLRKNVDASYITLLYYAFRPGTDYLTLDRYWLEYIVPVFSEEKNLLIEDSTACRILVALFGTNQQGWQISRVLDTSAVLVPEDLPRLDCRWIRSRVKLVYGILSKHLPKLKPLDVQDDASWKCVWSAWFNAVKLASSKEIKVSTETMEVMVQLTTIFRELLEPVTDIGDENIKRAAWLVSYAYNQLGNLPFLEERVFEEEASHKLEVVSGNSDRPKRNTGRVRSALTLMNKTGLALLARVDFSRFNDNDNDIFQPSQNLPLFLSTAIKLVQAGFKQLPVDIRHSPAGQEQSRTLDILDRSSATSLNNLTHSTRQLITVATWLDRRADGIAVSPIKSPKEYSAVLETPSDEDIIVLNSDTFGLPRTAVSVQKSALVQPTVPKQITVTTPDSRTRRRRTSSLHQQPRIRHDNSQIEFASIDSSPSILKAIDSQMLTERQKEVKERQSTDANSLFRDISSSSGPKSRTENTPRLQLSGGERSNIGSRRLGSSSPILPPAGSMDVFLGSSPTLNLRRCSSGDKLSLDHASSVLSEGTSLIHFSLDDPPSSPPAEALELLKGRDLFPNTQENSGPENDLGLSDAVDDVVEDANVVLVDQKNESVPGQPAVPPHFLSSAPLVQSVDEALTPRPLQLSTNETPIARINSSELESVYVLNYDTEPEDDDLISSQIDRDLKHASQDAVIVESPKKQKLRSSPRNISPAQDPSLSKTRKRPASEPENREEPQLVKRVKMSNVATTSAQASILEAPKPLDIVAELQDLLSKAKSGLTADQALAVLRMSAELTQLAVKAVQG